MSGSPTPSSSSSTLIVSPFPLLKPTNKRPDLKLDISPYSTGFNIDNFQMSGKGFIEPHRNNLPRRKRRVVTAPVVDAVIASEIEKTHLQTEAGPPSSSIEEYDDSVTTGTHDATPGFTTTPSPPIQTQSSTSSSSSSADTNITEPPSSLPASPPNKPPTFLTNPQTPKRALFHNHASSLVVTPSPLPITPTKGHLQPTSASLPRRHRSLVLSAAREQERRKSITDQQTSADSRKPDDAWKEVGSQRIRQTKADADTDLATKRIQSMCPQELAKGVTLGFLVDGDDHDVRIKIYDNSTTPLSSLLPSSPPSSPELHLQLSLPTDPFSYTDGTTSLTGSQIQQACTFINNHSSTTTTNNNTRMSVLILSPRMRPEEAMSIGVSYLAGIEDEEETKGVEESDGQYNDGHTYSTVHQLLMAFHDDPGSPSPSPIPHQPQLTTSAFSHSLSRRGGGIEEKSSWRGLRPEWRGVLSFDGIQRLDGIWTSARRS